MADDEQAEPVRIALDEHSELVDAYRVARRNRDRAVADMEEIRALLEKVLPDEDEAPDGVIGTVAGEPAVTYAPHARRDVDRDLLRRRYPHIAEECTTWQVRRPFLVSSGPATTNGETTP